MVSSFRALNEIIQMQKGSGLVLDWKQSTGSLLVGGDSRVIITKRVSRLYAIVDIIYKLQL